MNLALANRPLRLSEVVGQTPVKALLAAMVRAEDVPPSLIFSGTRGTGKTTTARILAAALNCTGDAPGDACAECPECRAVRNQSSLSVIEIDAASNGLVADIRQIREMVSYSHSGKWRVVLLDEAHSMSNEAFNALLKVLEEPPPRTVFCLITTEPEKILGTVASRSMRFDFRRIGTDQVVARLRQIADAEEIEASDDLLREIAVRSEGGMRDAVMTLDQVSRVGVTSAAGLREMLGLSNSAPEIIEAAMSGDLAAGLRTVARHAWEVGDYSSMSRDLSRLVADMIAAKAGAEPEVATAEERERIAALAERTTVQRLVRASRLLWELRGRARNTSDDQRTTMESAFVLLCDALGGIESEAPKAPAHQNGNGHGKLDAARMREMAAAASSG